MASQQIEANGRFGSALSTIHLTAPSSTVELPADHAETAPMAPPLAAAATRLLRAAGVIRLRLEFADLHGIARSKLIPIDAFAKVATTGTTFYGGMLHCDARGDDLVPAAYPAGPPLLADYQLTPDLTTLAVLDPAHAPAAARVICDLRRADGALSPFAPRTAVRRLVAAFAALDYLPRLGFEYEFSLTTGDRRPVFADHQYSATLRNLFDPTFADAIFAALGRLGVGVEGFFAEAAPGQFELPLAASDGLAAPDHAFAFKTTVKELAGRHGYHASFMTKPVLDEPNNALHVHQSLLCRRSGANAFATDDPSGLSPLAQCYLAGQLAHAPALTAFLAPTVNCYKSFKPHVFAPSNVSWGYDNRYAAVRVPRAAGPATRIETRIGGAAADPYLATAALLAAGLDGVQRRLPLPAPSSGDVTTARDLPPLPRSLDQALDALDADARLRALLPAELVELFLLVKRDEAARCRAAVPDYDAATFAARIDPWELREYGDLL